MATERIDIVISEKGSRVVERRIDDIGKGATKAASAVDFLKNALAALGAGIAARELIRQIDLYTHLQNRLRSTGLEAQTLSAVYKELLQASNDTRSSLEGSIELYSRLAVSSKELGVSQKQLIDFTKSLNQAIILSGASANEAQAGLIQLSQGMASGALRGDELRSVMEQLPAVADVIAKQLGVTRGELRKMGEDGKITANIILDAFEAARGELETKFAKTVPTIGQSFQILKNNFLDLIGEFDKATGISTALSQSLLFVANNLETVAKALVSVVSGLTLVAGAAYALNLVTRAVQALTAAIAANPIGFLLVVLTSAITALTLFRDQINLGVDDITTLGDLMRALGETVGAAFGKIWQQAQETFGPLMEIISGWFDAVDFSVIGVLRLVAKAVDSFVGFWRGAIDAVTALFRGLPSAMGDLFTQAVNVLLRKITDFVNQAGEILSPLTEAAGLGKIMTVDLQLTNENEGAAARLGQDVAGAFQQGFDSANLAQNFLGDLSSRAQEISKERAAAVASQAPVDLGGGGGGRPAAGMDATALNKLQEQLDSLMGSYDRVWAAQKEYTEGVALLNQAEAAGLITSERKLAVLQLMQEQLRDSLDPLGAINREMDRERELLKLTSEQREIETQVRSIQQDLMTQGIVLGDQELTQLREKLKLIQEETKASEARNQVYQDIIGPQEEYMKQLQAINSLVADGSITREQANAYLVDQNQLLLEGTLESQQAMVTNYESTMAQIDALRQADLISEQTATQLKARAQADLYAQQLSSASSFFGTLSNLASSENKELAAIGKAAAVTQATIDGVVAVQKALASAPPPVNYALAAAVGVSAAANVASILSTNLGFKTGGSFVVGGEGGADSQMVAFRATPGEKVSVARPEQVRKGDPYGGGAAPTVQSNTRIVNVLDPGMVGDFLSTPEGEQVLVNVMRRNSDSMRQIVGGG